MHWFALLFTVRKCQKRSSVSRQTNPVIALQELCLSCFNGLLCTVVMLTFSEHAWVSKISAKCVFHKWRHSELSASTFDFVHSYCRSCVVRMLNIIRSPAHMFMCFGVRWFHADCGKDLFRMNAAVGFQRSSGGATSDITSTTHCTVSSSFAPKPKWHRIHWNLQICN